MIRPGSILAATLAVGTEVVDGQIIDRNSAWISAKLSHVGVQVIEHRAVADDREGIRRALRELCERVDLLFVTGGLGPTSDDFTRDLLAEHCGQPLEYDPASWRHIEERLGERGIQPKEIQKQQCYFPRGAQVLLNPAGTANAFSFQYSAPAHSVKIFALPGPPTEIAAVWERNLAAEMDRLIPAASREQLTIFRCLGRGESDVAEMTEEVIKGSGLRVGYRAHLPYVEVKLWFRDRATSAAVLDGVEAVLKPWLVSRDDQDAADVLIDSLLRGTRVEIFDQVTGGILQERLLGRLRERKLADKPLPLIITSRWAPGGVSNVSEGVDFLQIDPSPDGLKWLVSWRTKGRAGTLEVPPAFQYKITTERAKRFITEKALLLFGTL